MLWWVTSQVAVSADVLSTHCIDSTTRGFFRLSHEGKSKPDPFWAALCSRCGEHMKQQGIRRTMSWPLFTVFLGVAAMQVGGRGALLYLLSISTRATAEATGPFA